MAWGRGFKQKYGAKRVTNDGYSFSSKLESAVYTILKAREQAGELKVLRTQAQYHLTKARILYKPDFECLDLKTNEIFYVESKGFETPEWRIKLRLWKCYATHKLEIWKGSHSRPYLDEIITPEINIDE